MTARVSMLLKSRASLIYFRACFLPGRAKDLSAPGTFNNVRLRISCNNPRLTAYSVGGVVSVIQVNTLPTRHVLTRETYRR